MASPNPPGGGQFSNGAKRRATDRPREKVIFIEAVVGAVVINSAGKLPFSVAVPSDYYSLVRQRIYHPGTHALRHVNGASLIFTPEKRATVVSSC